jgi:hypothetical protein
MDWILTLGAFVMPRRSKCSSAGRKIHIFPYVRHAAQSQTGLILHPLRFSRGPLMMLPLA